MNIAEAVPDYRQRQARSLQLKKDLLRFIDDFKTWGCPEPLLHAIRHFHGEIHAEPGSLGAELEGKWPARRQAQQEVLRGAAAALEEIANDEARPYEGDGAFIAPQISMKPETGRRGELWVTDLCRFLRSQHLTWRNVERVLRVVRSLDRKFEPWLDCALNWQALRDRLKPHRKRRLRPRR